MYHSLLALFILISTSLNVYSATQSDCTNHHCIAVINAGSTGSRVYIYAYDLDATKTPINITEVWSNSIKPGLATLESQRSVIFPYLNRLFDKFPDYKGVHGYFYATAGMRLISKANSNSTYSLVRAWFNEKKNLKLVEARTILGEEEGIFDWLAVNYHLKRLNKSNKPLVAVVDIGGASTQIAFSLPTQTAIIKKMPNIYSFTLYGQNLKIASYSFLGLGENQVLDNFKDYSPCYTQGYSLSSEVMGKGDMPQCIQAISKKINTYPFKEVKNLLSQYSPKEWYLIGGVTHMLDNTHLSKNKQFINKEMAEQSEKQLCQISWPTLKNQYKDQEPSKTCATSSYIYSLLVNGYGISSKEPINLMPNNTSTDWSIGVVFMHP